MKKQNLKSLTLNKKLVSNLQYHKLQGGKAGTEDITNCNFCGYIPPKTLDGCDTFTTHTSRNPMGGVPSNCDVSN
ncbi:hypothetical protein [uncultured Kordia sp.]|uniref:hypothetical protein n=1 Tax=uncultured Kordia sp. TaxID=507699 RepID=UPI002616B531|nr:hypothetical protein [uncultured Kordia sp.]